MGKVIDPLGFEKQSNIRVSGWSAKPVFKSLKTGQYFGYKKVRGKSDVMTYALSEKEAKKHRALGSRW